MNTEIIINAAGELRSTGWNRGEIPDEPGYYLCRRPGEETDEWWTFQVRVFEEVAFVAPCSPFNEGFGLKSYWLGNNACWQGPFATDPLRKAA